MKENLGIPGRSSQRGPLTDERALADLEEALASFDEAIKLKPDYAEAWHGKGVTLAELNRFEEALACFDEAIRIKPDYAKAWHSRAVTIRKLKGPRHESEEISRGSDLLGKSETTQELSNIPAQGSSTTSKDYLNDLINLERYESSDKRYVERGFKPNHTTDRLDSNPFRLLTDGESLVVDGSNVIRQRCEPHNGKPCNNPARVWVLHQLLAERKEWEKTAFPGAMCLIVIDASLRHHVDNQAALDELSNTQAVIQMPPGHPSDSLILKEADELKAVVLTNDAKMKEQYGSQYPWLRDSSRLINYVVVSDDAKKIEYVRNTRVSHTVPKQKAHEHPAKPESPKPTHSPPQAAAAPSVHEDRVKLHDWFPWLRRKEVVSLNEKERSFEGRQVQCSSCGAHVEVTNPRVRFCYKCRAQLKVPGLSS